MSTLGDEKRGNGGLKERKVGNGGCRKWRLKREEGGDLNAEKKGRLVK
jgi:hypothetical protein